VSEPKQLLLNLFEMGAPGHITHGMWRQEGNQRQRYADLSYWTELAQLLEHGGFDAVFLADVLGGYDVHAGSLAPALRMGLQIPQVDPSVLVPAMAVVTDHLGFGLTASTTYEPPFSFARRMSSLDLLTRGRVAWNVVTSYLPGAARNFGLADQVDHDTRYAIAEEFLQVAYQLWEGSWDDDAVLADAEAGVYTRPDGVRPIDHVGQHFRVAGPHLVEPTPQRTPLLYQATASSAGIALAGRHAEVVFTGGPNPGVVRRTAEGVRAAAEREGRSRHDVRFVVQAAVITGRTDDEVSEKLARYRSTTDPQGKFVHMSVPFDAPSHPVDRTVREALLAEGRDDLVAAGGLPLDLTVGQLATGIDEAWQQHFFVAGTPDVVADEVERWLDEEGIDGINLRQYHSTETARDFVELVAPELRRRGRLRAGYEPGQTLRERTTGGGARLPDTHPAARYRSGR
jgi:long-chain alkane monooxygenase